MIEGDFVRLMFVTLFLASCDSEVPERPDSFSKEYCGFQRLDELIEKLNADGFQVGFKSDVASFSAKRQISGDGIVDSTLIVRISHEDGRIVSCAAEIVHTGP